MLGKLLKHEFRATSRIMGPLYLVILVLSFFGNLSIRLFDSAHSRLLNLLGGLTLGAFGIAIVGVCVMTVVLMVNRFRSNLLSDEGYVMFTLPVSVHQLVWSKIIVSFVWFMATTVAISLSGVIVSFRVSYVTKFFLMLKELFQQLTAYYAVNGAAFLIEALIFLFLGCAAICLLFYASIAMGHSFANHKKLLSVAFFFGLQFLAQLVGSLSIFGLDDLDLFWGLSEVAAMHAGMWIGIAGALLYAAIFYIITTFMLKNHLNLE